MFLSRMDKLCYLLFHLVALSSLLTRDVALADCNVYEAQSCSHIDKLGSNFNWYVPKELLEDHCRVWRIALSCALDHVKDCDSATQDKFISQDAVVQTVCNRLRYAFEKSESCFMQPEVRNTVNECKISDSMEGVCSFLDNVRYCAHDSVVDKSGCNMKDANLAAHIMHQYVQPLASANNCNLEEFDGIDINDIITPPTTPMTSEATTTIDVTSDMTSETGNNTAPMSTPTQMSGNASPDMRAKWRIVGLPLLLSLPNYVYSTYLGR